MARNLRLSGTAADEIVYAVGHLLDGGELWIYDGSKPASPDEPTGMQQLLARLRFADPAFQAPAAGVAEAYPIQSDPSARRSGIASWFRATADNGLPILDGTVGEKDADLILTNRNIQQYSEVSVRTFALAMLAGSK